MTYLETRVYRLSTLSPIHIQAGKLEYGEGFIRVGKNVYVVDAPKLQKEIFQFGGLETVNQYTQIFSEPNSDTTIAEFLNTIGYNYRSKIRKISKGIVRLPTGNRFMQSGLGQHFIPGSSIKGAIKTAVLYHLMKNILTHQPRILDTFVDDKITAYLSNPSNNQKQRFAEELLELAFQSNHPRERFPNGQRTDECNGPFTDLFKAIKIKDAIIKKSREVQFENILFTTLNGANQVAKKRVGRNFECFHGETTIEITVDHEILESFKRAGVTTPPFSNVPSLIRLCQDFAQAQWKPEKDFIGTYPGDGNINLSNVDAFYAKNKNRATLRVGWGTGMLGTTISLLLEEPIRVDLRNEVISGGRHRRPKPAPKSRRFVLEDGQPIYPLGWTELQEK